MSSPDEPPFAPRRENSPERATLGGSTPLDATIDKIGMGHYQYMLLGLCGLGWLADNMWLQAFAIALPRVQDHFSVSDSRIGWLSTSSFCGMMVGAVAWGSLSDLLGRVVAFNATLVLTALFGLLATFSPTFPSLCFSLFLLGTALGGSMPTDGTLFMENVPHKKRYLLTALSIFFSFGGVTASIIGLLVVPQNSCPEGSGNIKPPCDLSTQNLGWRYLFLALTAITTVLFIARVFFFQLYESPRFLVHAGRPEDAIIVLQNISRANGVPIILTLEDVVDQQVPEQFNDDEGDSFGHPISYHAREPAAYPHNHQTSRAPGYIARFLPSRLAKTLSFWLDKVVELLEPKWRRTTILIWGTWFGTALAYTMFNVYFPKLVELRFGKEGGGPGSRVAAMKEVIIYTLGGTPGALVGAWMVETRLGRRKSLVLSTALTSVLCLMFTGIDSHAALTMSSIGISLTASIMGAVLMTPEMFPTRVRGTACGNASAINRIGGMIAPLLGGTLIGIDVSFPVYASAAMFLFAAACALALPFESAEEVEALKKEKKDLNEYTILQ